MMVHAFESERLTQELEVLMCYDRILEKTFDYILLVFFLIIEEL